MATADVSFECGLIDESIDRRAYVDIEEDTSLAESSEYCWVMSTVDKRADTGVFTRFESAAEG